MSPQNDQDKDDDELRKKWDEIIRGKWDEKMRAERGPNGEPKPRSTPESDDDDLTRKRYHEFDPKDLFESHNEWFEKRAERDRENARSELAGILVVGVIIFVFFKGCT